MKSKKLIVAALLSAVFTLTLHAQTSAFTYQGRLTDSSGPANGTYDLQFTIYDADTGGSVVAGPITNSAVAVTNGLFTTTLDFGPGVFNGSDRWLAIGVATNGSGVFTNLSPRQLITSTPYAIQAANAAVAASASSVAAANVTGTLTTAQLPTSVVTNGASSVNITGTFSGNGSGMTNVPGTMPWQSAGGTSVTAAPNQAYLLTNAALDTVTLPTNATVGDVVTVSGTGSNSWEVVAGSGQSVAGENSTGIYWSDTNDAPSTNWDSVASSADGTRLVAVDGGGIWTSTNSGVTWSDTTNAPSAGWFSVASSADGTRLVAVAYGGGIYTSTNSGVTWSDTNNAPSSDWTSVASSSDGTKLVAVTETIGAAYIYTSTNSGVTWSDTNNAPSAAWISVASSSDGTKLVAVILSGGIYTSTNSGATWSANNNAPFLDWQSVASSSDGTKLVAIIYAEGGIYTSTDSGVTWSDNNDAPTTNWVSVASSADGTKLVAVVQGGQIWTSSGTAIEAPGTTVQFQYLGNGVWQPVGEAAGQIVGTLSTSQLPSNLMTNRETGVILSGTFSGSGSGLTSLNASQLTSGTVGLAQLPSVVVTNHETGVTLDGTFSGTFSGVGTGLTGLNAANLTGSVPAASLTSVPAASLTGTVPDTRLSANVALRSGGNAFSGNQTVTGGNLGIGTSTPTFPLEIAGGNNTMSLVASSSTIGTWMDLENTSAGGTNWEMISTGSGNGEGAGKLLFEAGPGFGSAGPLPLALSPDGNVGIGTSSPNEEKLVVSGGVDVMGASASPTTDSGLGLSFESYGGRIQSFRNLPLILNPIANNVGIGITNPSSLLDVAGTITCTTLNQTSDRNAKRDFTAINPARVLQKVASLPITEWQYKAGPQGVEHLGPMAQDFHAAFGLNGNDDKHITTVDEGGVALAAIQGLNEKVESGKRKAESQIQGLTSELAQKQTEITELKTQLDKIEALLTHRLNRGAR